jgi:hypothetical protein
VHICSFFSSLLEELLSERILRRYGLTDLEVCQQKEIMDVLDMVVNRDKSKSAEPLG